MVEILRVCKCVIPQTQSSEMNKYTSHANKTCTNMCVCVCVWSLHKQIINGNPGIRAFT